MTKEGKTIDGFSVRRAGDSKLVSRSKTNRISSNKTPRKVRVISQNDPLVKRKKTKVLEATSMDMKPMKRRKASKTNTAEMFTAKPKAFNMTIKSTQADEDYLEEFTDDTRIEQTDEDTFSEVVTATKASDGRQ